jgi:hypothetical protein
LGKLILVIELNVYFESISKALEIKLLRLDEILTASSNYFI